MIVVYKGFSLSTFVLCNLLLSAVTESRFSQRSISAENDGADNYSNEMTHSSVKCNGVACVITVSTQLSFL